MIKLGKKILAAGIAITLAAATLMGCGSNAGKPIATLDGQEVDYALVNFMVRYNQAQMQSMYGAMFGETMWESYGDTTKTGVVDGVQQMLVLEKHMDEYSVSISDEEQAKITEAAKAFMDSNEESVLKAMTASQETVERMLSLQLIQVKMRKEMIKDVDREVSDEEAAQKTIQYVLFSTADKTGEDGTATPLTDEEKAELKAQAEQILEAVKGGTDMDEAAKAVDETKTASTLSYGTDNGSIPDELRAAADALKDEEVADSVIEAETGYYVLRMVSTFDQEATENQKQTIITQRENDRFQEIYDGWKESAEFTTDENLLNKINFVDIFEVKTTESETGTETDAVSETGTDTEGGSETAAVTEAQSQADTAEQTEAQSDTETSAQTETTASESESQSE